MDRAIELSLETWHPEDHPLHLDPLHPAIALAGKAGELLNLYKKEKFKPGVSWWDCKYCGKSEIEHENSNSPFRIIKHDYTPKILDKLGDLWYYLRILAYQQEQDLSEWVLKDRDTPSDKLEILIGLSDYSTKLLSIYNHFGHINLVLLSSIFNWLVDILFLLDHTLDELTELNYAKLKDGDNHRLEINQEE